MAARTTRYECKYRIPAKEAQPLLEWIAMRMRPDDFGEGGSASYSVHSLYLDDNRWSIYDDTRTGAFDRFKLRARTYGFTPGHNVFLEVKRREGELMWKTRAEVPRGEAIRILLGEAPRNLAWTPALEAFRAESDRRQAFPRVWVTYRRDAWVGEDRGKLVRITFDSNICCAPPTPDLSEPPRWHPLPEVEGVIILELKYNGSYPGWVADMIRQFELERKSMSKYRHSVDVLRSKGFAMTVGSPRHVLPGAGEVG